MTGLASGNITFARISLVLSRVAVVVVSVDFGSRGGQESSLVFCKKMTSHLLKIG